MDENPKITIFKCGHRHAKLKYYRCKIGLEVFWCDENCRRRDTDFCAIRIKEAGENPVEVVIGTCQKHANLVPALAQIVEAVESIPDHKLGFSVLKKLGKLCQDHGLSQEVKERLTAEESEFMERKGIF